MALSCVLCKPIHITKIRAGREKPGLRPQHLTGIKLVSQLCKGKLDGGEVNSSDVTFMPGVMQQGRFTADTKTAGSVNDVIPHDIHPYVKMTYVALFTQRYIRHRIHTHIHHSLCNCMFKTSIALVA